MDPLLPKPRLTHALPGSGGIIRQQLDDFVVEEIPHRAPAKQGDFLRLWVEKRDLGSDALIQHLSRTLEIPVQAIGTAGKKDKRAVTRQFVSVPADVQSRLSHADSPHVRILDAHRDTESLKPGDSRGNRFHITLRECGPDAHVRAHAILEHLAQHGMPNYYGPQRFGGTQKSFKNGLAILQKRSLKKPPKGFVRDFALSVVQSALFNECLRLRMKDDLLFTLLRGDVVRERGRLRLVQDTQTKGAILCGPIFGPDMFPAEGEPAAREKAVLGKMQLTLDDFKRERKLGTRRSYLVFPKDVGAEQNANTLSLEFSLPPGAYATVLLKEVTGQEVT